MFKVNGLFLLHFSTHVHPSDCTIVLCERYIFDFFGASFVDLFLVYCHLQIIVNGLNNICDF